MSHPDHRPLAGDGARQLPRPNPIVRYLMRFDDARLLRWAFRGMVAGALGVLVLDFQDLAASRGWSLSEIGTPTEFAPVPPPAVEGGTDGASADPRPFVTTQETELRQPMRFALEPGGVLRARGTIVPGTAAAFDAEMEERGEYVRVVSLDSPGGALDDAMAMATLMRQRGLASRVEDGTICASSCPLVLAGGTERSVGPKAAVGVHQFYAATEETTRPAQAMADAQRTTARIARHLTAMGVDPALWLHALDTPPRSLYYFTPEQMASYRLVTRSQDSAAAQ